MMQTLIRHYENVLIKNAWLNIGVFFLFYDVFLYNILENLNHVINPKKV